MSLAMSARFRHKAWATSPMEERRMTKTKIWFPTVVEKIQDIDTQSFTWQELIELNEELNIEIPIIRKEKNIKPVMSFCSACQKRHPCYPAPITIRAMLFALNRFSDLPQSHLLKLDREWRSYQRRHGLDGRGRPKAVLKRA